MASTVANHTLPLLPSVRQPKFSVSPASVLFFPIESRFGSLRVSVLIIISRHCSSDIVECSADKLMRSATASRAQKRTQIGASPNAYFTCFIFQSIHLGFSIIQLTIYSSDSEEQPENRKNKENAASELSFNRSKLMFLHHFHSHN